MLDLDNDSSADTNPEQDVLEDLDDIHKAGDWFLNNIKKRENKNQEQDKISQCNHCNCMTKTILGLCGKCRGVKQEKSETEGENGL